MIKRIYILFVLLAASVTHADAQKAALKTNLFYGAYAYSPNMGLEFGLGKHSTLDLSGGFNHWNLDGSRDNNRKLVHWLAQAEYRHWFCQRFNGHFLGVHALGGQYNIAGHNMPLLFGKGSKDFRYQGWGAGAGVSYGYCWILGNRWGLEANIGVGYVRLHYDKYKCAKCGAYVTTENRNYFGPTRAGLNLIFIIK